MTGAQLKAYRKRLKLTQRELAVLAGVATNTIARWERDELRIRESTVKLLGFIAENVCTCGALKRNNAKYGHLHWCPLWTDPAPHISQPKP